MKHTNPFLNLRFAAIILFLLLTGCSSKAATVSPQPPPERDMELQKSIELQLQKMDPAAVPIFQEATRLSDAAELEKAKDLYEKVVVLAPNFSAVYRRLAYIELTFNNIPKAEELSRKAVELEEIGYNQTVLALVLLQKDTSKDSYEAFYLASDAVKQLPDDDQANIALMMAAGVTDNLDVMRQTNRHLLELQPDNPLAHYYAGLIFANDGNWLNAEEELKYSQELGMPSDAVQQALNGGISRNALLIRFMRWGGISLVLWLLGFGMIFLIGTYLSRATIQALNKMEPGASFQVKPEESRVRSLYRGVIAILSLYFYVSIPFVVLLLLIVVGGILYIFLLIGTIPIQLSILLVITLFVSLFALVRSLFLRIRNVPPGRQLLKKDAPDLWMLVENVARKLKTRPVDAIYITPWAGISVYEEGSIIQKLRGQGKRNLILGMGVLPGLTQSQLAAVLAHEYGHFSNQDTAGGDLAHQVYASLHQIAQGLIQGNAAQVFNPVWLFVLGYQRVFLKVTLGASRLQEILADRYAAVAYGSQNFVDGLKNVIRQSIAFPLQADHEVRTLLNQKLPVHNLYNLAPQESLKEELEKQVEDALKHTTSEYDSHPGFQERVNWIQRLHLPPLFAEEKQSSVLDLFPNAEDLQREMTADLMKRVRAG